MPHLKPDGSATGGRFIRTRGAFLFCLLVCFAGGQTVQADDSTDPMELQISIGRMAVMVAQGETALGLVPPAETSGPDQQAATVQRLYGELYDAVLAYNQLQAEACARGAVGPDLCDRAFFPRWLKLPGRQHGSLADLRKWSEQAQARIAPLTGALCDRAISNGADASLCAIE